MHIPFEIDNIGGAVRFDYILGYTLLEHYHDNVFIENFRNNIIVMSESTDVTIRSEYYLVEMALIILSLNTGALKDTFEELLYDVLNIRELERI